MVGYQVESLEVERSWQFTRGAEVQVAILDCGVHCSDALPQSRVSRLYCDGSDQRPVANAHGTYCASLIASADEEYPGMAPEASLLSVQVTLTDGVPELEHVKSGLKLALDRGCDVISCSFVLPDIDDDLLELVRQAHLRGVLVLVAAGNDPDALAAFGEKVPHATIVGATDRNGHPMHGRHTPWTDVYCPGAALDVIDGEANHRTWEGRSSGATAIAAGVAALALAAVPRNHRANLGLSLEGLLKQSSSATPFPSPGGPPKLLQLRPERLVRMVRTLTG